jgi:hypothetical protein
VVLRRATIKLRHDLRATGVVRQLPGPYFGPMPPSKKIAAARKGAILLRGRAQPLGTVEAPDEHAAEAVAAKRFGLSNEQRRRLALRAEDTE